MIISMILQALYNVANGVFVAMILHYTKKKRAKACVKYGVIDSLIVTFAITLTFEIIARPLSKPFALSGIVRRRWWTFALGLRELLASVLFLWGLALPCKACCRRLGRAIEPLLSAFLRLVAFTLPIAYLFVINTNAVVTVCRTLPVAEALTFFVSVVLLIFSMKKSTI